jgi:hypothetical protein
MTKGSCFCNCEQAKKRLARAKHVYEQDSSLGNGLDCRQPRQGSGGACHPLERSERIAQCAFGLGCIWHRRVLHLSVCLPLIG